MSRCEKCRVYDTNIACHECQELICKDCAIHCGKGTWRCSQCRTRCFSCKSDCCPNDVHTCCKCNSINCPRCLFACFLELHKHETNAQLICVDCLDDIVVKPGSFCGN